MLAKSYVEAPNKFRVFTVNIFNDLSIDNNKREKNALLPTPPMPTTGAKFYLLGVGFYLDLETCN